MVAALPHLMVDCRFEQARLGRRGPQMRERMRIGEVCAWRAGKNGSSFNGIPDGTITHWRTRSVTANAMSEILRCACGARGSENRYATEAAMSGNRWSTGLKGRAWRLKQDARLFERTIDQGFCKLYRDARRRRRQRMADRSGGHTDRTEVIGLAVRGMLLRLTIIGGSDRRHDRTAPGARAVRRVNVSEGQGKIDGQRDEREP